MSVAVCRAIMPALVMPLDDKPKKPFFQPMAMARFMSHESLHLCTESLGCETGSIDLLLDDPPIPIITCPSPAAAAPEADTPPPLDQEEDQAAAGELRAVRYHRSRPQRAFPPPLPSMTMSCTQMRPHRRDGRLVLEAVPVRPHAYLHAARRQGGRLTLCFVDCSTVRHHTQTQTQSTILTPTPTRMGMDMVLPTEDQHDEDEEEEDEVELVDRGTVVEVVAASGKAQRSRIVINKFVGGTPDHQPSRCVVVADPAPGSLRRVPSSTMTLAAAVAAASTGMDKEDAEEEDVQATTMTKMLFTSRVGDREELVQSVRRCRQLRQKPLFIIEPYCITTTSS